MSIADQIWDSKYRLKQFDGTPIDVTVKDTWWRVASALASCEPEDQIVDRKQDFFDVMVNGYFSPAGRIIAGAGSGRNVTLSNCLSGETLILTAEYGLVPIGEIAGETVNVLDGDGNWVEAPINVFGFQKTSPVTLKGGYNGRERKTIYATAAHRWILEGGDESTTEYLDAGNVLKFVHRKDVGRGLDYSAGVRHGVVYGDGSQRPSGEVKLRLCGSKKALVNFFESWTVINPDSLKGDVNVYCGRDQGRQMDLKNLPHVGTSVEYLTGFLRGWMATDGCVARGKALISCGAHEADWLRKFGPIAGMEVSCVTKLGDETNYGLRNKTIFNVHFHRWTMIEEDFILNNHRSKFEVAEYPWVVESVGPMGEPELVYCPRVTTTDSVQLDLGIHTGQCFTMGTIPDSMGGIFESLKEAALTMQQGGGIGYDFSPIRPKGAEVKGVQAGASGPLSFMDVWDAMCRTVMSAGSRRGAMMATMRCDHPDIFDFVNAKKDPARLRMFNLSVLVTDAFMDAVKNEEWWDLKFDGVVYRTVQAPDLWNEIMRSTYAQAEPGVIFIDRVNADHNLGYLENIATSNPCVTGDTPILTVEGWMRIDDLVGQTVTAWNGFEWSNVTPKITGHNRKILTIKTSDGCEIECTENHKFIMADGSRKEAKDLSNGDSFEKSLWPVIIGTESLANSYEQGFFSGDGTCDRRGRQYVYLYGDKKKLVDKFKSPISVNEYAITGGYEGTDLSETKLYLFMGRNHYKSKFYVPEGKVELQDRLDWFAGLLDSDGYAYRSYNSVSLQISSKDRDFLYQVKLMLNTLGVAGQLSPMHDCHRLTITACDVRQLVDLGLVTHRLDLSDNNPQRNASRFIKFVECESTYGEAETVYCFTESLRHAGCFNGVRTGQCGEKPMGPYASCLLGSINVAKLVVEAFTEDADVFWPTLRNTVLTAIRMMDNVIEVGNFPLKAQLDKAKDDRQLGLGVTGLADALIMMGMEYGSDEAVEFTEELMKAIALAAYDASIQLAIERGPFPTFNAAEFLSPTRFAGRMLPTVMQKQIREHGIRNGLLLSIAPTGTISLFAGNVSSGIEPIFAPSFTRKVLQADGSRTEERVEDYAVAAYREFWKTQFDQAPHGCPEPEWSDDYLPSYFVTAQTLPPEAHVRMQAAVQKWVDSSISKTVNLPEDISFEDFEAVYTLAYESGCKGCTTYRPNEITGSVLSVDAPKVTPVVTPTLAARPDALDGATYKMKWPGDKDALYVTINNDAAGNPFELFLNTKNIDHHAWMAAMARTISAVFRRGGDVSFIAHELREVFDPKGGAWISGKYVPSMIAAIGDVILRHIGDESGAPTIAQEMEDEDIHHSSTQAKCTSCGEYAMKNEGGCETCTSCGHSKCG